MPDTFTAQLAIAVRSRRALLRLSQQDVADLAGVSERFVRFVEQAKPSVQLDSLLAVLGTLGLEFQLATRSSDAARGPASRLPVNHALTGQAAVPPQVSQP